MTNKKRKRPVNKKSQIISSKKKKQLKRKKKKNEHWLVKLAPFLFFLFCYLFLLSRISFTIVNGSSMEPTLHNSDWLLLKKKAAPKRYSVINFSPSSKKKEFYVKRIIGMPGDQIYVDGQSLYLNREPLSKKYFPKMGLDELPDGTTRIMVSKKISKELENLSEIPKGKYFVLGDNRNNSKDSRVLGLVSEQQFSGVVHLRLFPLTKWGLVH